MEPSKNFMLTTSLWTSQGVAGRNAPRSRSGRAEAAYKQTSEPNACGFQLWHHNHEYWYMRPWILVYKTMNIGIQAMNIGIQAMNIGI